MAFVGLNDDELTAIRRMAGLATPMALRVAVPLGLPDRLLAEPATADQLATELSVSPPALDLLLGHLVTLGFVEQTPTATARTSGSTSPNTRTSASPSTAR